MTRPIKYTLLTSVLLCAAQPLWAVAQGQDDTAAGIDEQRWYKVELMVFSNESPAAATAEQWQATPQLSYPPQVRFLVDEALYASRATAYEAGYQTDSSGRQILEEIRDPGTTAQEHGSVPDATGQPPARPTPFIALAESQRELADRATRMQRTGRYSVLFHETWVQPVQAQSAALPIALDRSGDTLEWPRLQGTVTLHLSRYLHINTNLWLNTAGSYLPGRWTMPAPPLSPPSLLGGELPEFEEKKLAMAEARGALKPVPLPEPLEMTSPGSTPPGTPVPGLPTGLPANATSGTAGAAMTADGEQELAPQYPFRHAVLLQQSRKMRSNELHYIDHPLLGIIVKFTPLDAEELEAMAAQQAPLDAATL